MLTQAAGSRRTHTLGELIMFYIYGMFLRLFRERIKFGRRALERVAVNVRNAGEAGVDTGTLNAVLVVLKERGIPVTAREECEEAIGVQTSWAKELAAETERSQGQTTAIVAALNAQIEDAKKRLSDLKTRNTQQAEIASREVGRVEGLLAMLGAKPA